MSDLVTGEAVPLELRLAKLPSRALAMVIDLILLAIAASVIFAAAIAIITEIDPALAAALALSVGLGLFVGVPMLVETLTRGKSVGKLVLGLRVVRDDGGPIRFRHALTRGLAGFFADFYLTAGVGAVLCSLLNERGKRIGDWLAGTVVIRERVTSRAVSLPPVPPQLASWATMLELSRLPDDLAMAAHGYLTRGHDLSPRVRDEMGAHLATEVSRVVTPPAPPGTPAWAYLAAVLTERGRRQAARFAERARQQQAFDRPAGPPPTQQPAQPPNQPVQPAEQPAQPADQPADQPAQPDDQPAQPPSQPPASPPPRDSDGFAPPA
jgi:uncharacterized RDD family membrane protein YckC